MRKYVAKRITAKHLRQGIDLMLCPDCGCIVFERMTHDAWHAANVRTVRMSDRPTFIEHRVDL